MYKNKSGQGVYVFAYDTVSNIAKTGDAANITANISKNGDAVASVADTNPTEIGGGVYWFGLTEAETNAESIAIVSSSTTVGVQLDVVSISTGTSADVIFIGGDKAAADNLELQYGGTGLSGPTFPANQNDITLMQGAGFDSATDSLKSIRDRGDAAWTGKGGPRII